jgi:hypothetical protein
MGYDMKKLTEWKYLLYGNKEPFTHSKQASLCGAKAQAGGVVWSAPDNTACAL